MKFHRLHFLVRNVDPLFRLLFTVWCLSSCQVGSKSTKWSKPNLDSDCPIEYRGVDATRGVISSKNYPLPYPVDTCYMWRISAQTPGDIITISFSDLDVHSGPDGDCTLDSIEIGPGGYKQCSSIPDNYPPPYVSTKSNVWIRFVSAPASNVEGSRRGFSLTYIIGSIPSERCEEDEFRCNNNKCILNNWKCNGGDECGDGSDESGCHVISKPTQPPDNSCGEDKFVCVSAKTQQLACFLNIQRCNGNVDCLSGEDEQNCDNLNQCGGILSTSNSGFFSSPNFPQNYPVNVECEWLILVRESDVIQLRFDVFRLESGYDTDYVIVYDGQDSNSDRIGKYYGKHLPPAVIQSTSYKMYVKFHSDGSIPQHGFNVTYQVKGICLENQVACGFNEQECYESSQSCDGKWDCPQHGGDERGCGTCRADEFSCGKDNQCYPESERCNGKGKCRNMSDEKDCSPALCGPVNGTFLCKNGRCIQETWQCDSQADCADASDEMNCPVTTRVVTAAVIGSLICGLLLVIALGCTCKLYALRMQDHYGGRYETPLTRIQNQIGRRRAPPPYNEAMVTSRPYDEVQRERREQLLNENQQLSDSGGRNISNVLNNNSSNNVADTIGVPPVPTNGEQVSVGESDSAQQVDIIAAGCAAQWRRNRPQKHVRQEISSTPGETGSSRDPDGDEETASACASVDSVTVSADDSNCIKAVCAELEAPVTDDARQRDGISSVSSVESEILNVHLEGQSTTGVRRGSLSSEDSTISDTRLLLA